MARIQLGEGKQSSCRLVVIGRKKGYFPSVGESSTKLTFQIETLDETRERDFPISIELDHDEWLAFLSESAKQFLSTPDVV